MIVCTVRRICLGNWFFFTVHRLFNQQVANTFENVQIVLKIATNEVVILIKSKKEEREKHEEQQQNSTLISKQTVWAEAEWFLLTHTHTHKRISAHTKKNNSRLVGLVLISMALWMVFAHIHHRHIFSAMDSQFNDWNIKSMKLNTHTTIERERKSTHANKMINLFKRKIIM